MRFIPRKIAVAAAFAVVGASAIAAPNVDPSNYTSGTTDIYVTGSSAVDAALSKFFAEACDANTLDAYRSDNGTRTYFLWTCQSSVGGGGTFGLTSGNTKIAIHKNTGSSTEGTSCLLTGSGAGTSSVSSCNNATFSYLKATDVASQAGCTETAVPAAGTLSAYKLFTCATSVTPTQNSVNPHFGFSDSEPQQYSTLSDSAINAQLVSASPFTMIFGVPVSKVVRDALQAQQGLTVGDDGEANMPSLTTAQLNGIFTGTYTKWSDATGIGGLATDTIYFVRRSAGSGTTRISSQQFDGEFCSPGVLGTQGGTALSTTPRNDCVVPGAHTVWQAGITEDLLTCIDNYNGANAGAIGWASTDYAPGANGSPSGYRFVKVDGYAPTLVNVADGRYKDWAEMALNYSKARLGAAPAGDVGAFYTRFKTASTSSTFLGELVTALANTGGWNGGLMASAVGGGTTKQPAGWGMPAVGVGADAGKTVQSGRSTASLAAYPVNPFTRTQGVTRWNLCTQPQPQQAGYQAK